MKNSAPSDYDLMAQVAAGEESAFTEFYDRHAPQVLGLLVRMIGNRGEAEDVLQEAFWQVWRTASQYDAERASPKAWLFLIARSRALDLLRRRPNNGTSALVSEPAVQSDPLTPLVENESAARLQAALAQLPEVQSSAIRLAFYAGMTYESVAQRQAIPLGTAKTRIRLGMKQLRTILRNLDRVAGS